MAQISLSGPRLRLLRRSRGPLADTVTDAFPARDARLLQSCPHAASPRQAPVRLGTSPQTSLVPAGVWRSHYRSTPVDAEPPFDHRGLRLRRRNRIHSTADAHLDRGLRGTHAPPQPASAAGGHLGEQSFDGGTDVLRRLLGRRAYPRRADPSFRL